MPKQRVCGGCLLHGGSQGPLLGVRQRGVVPVEGDLPEGNKTLSIPEDFPADDVPAEFMCGITGDVMSDAVRDGGSRNLEVYDNRAMQEWLRRRLTNPFTREVRAARDRGAAC